MKTFINVKDGSNLTDISPVLTCIRTLSECDAIWDKDKSKCVRSLSLKQLNESNIPKKDGFYFAVSLRDGTCLFTSSSITDHLGFPKDMLHGQCFMNSVFQKDHITFANHLTQGLNACFIQGKSDESHLVVNSFFCRLRVYQGLKFGFALPDKVQYKPFKITLHINDLVVDDLCVENSSANLCVKATATAVYSAYTAPEEIPGVTSFSTRHTASCHFSHVDFSAVPYIGYLPQDMVGISVFDFYHIDDMPQLKDIYELVVKENGSSFRSKPYRFKVQNGCYIMLETEWSCFINPWSHKLEFVVGQHRVMKGPLDINIFNEGEVTENISSDENLMKSQKIQKEIKAVLSQPVKNFDITKSKRLSNKRKHDSLVYNCIDEGYVENNKKGTSAKQDGIKDRSHLDSDSVIGHISPCREGVDSSVSSGTPSTVHHLRYQDNIERYFASQLTILMDSKNYSDGSEEYNKNEKSSSGDGYQTSSSGSGNGSGHTTKEPNTSKNYENKMQESSSNSLKCMSSITANDSGYGNNPNINHATSSKQLWKDSTDCGNNNAEKFSSCMALTERSLSAHNRNNHKHLKQRKSKSSIEHNVPAIKDNSWFQTKDSGHSKRKKRLHNHNVTASTPNQTATVSAHITPSWYHPPSISTTAANLSTSSTHVPQVSYSCAVPPNNCSGSTPPFYIPVLYMGGIPYYPSMSSIHLQTGNSFWPCPVSTTPPTVPATPSFPFPIMTPCSHHSNIMPCPMFPFTSFNPFSGIPYGVQSSGVTATSPLITTTTTVASGTTPAFKNAITSLLSTNEPKGTFTNKTKEMNNGKQDGKAEENECDMQVEDTLSSFTQSSSMQSAEKEEDTDFELKKCHSGPSRSDKVELSSEIAFRFQMELPNIDEILKKDLEKLKSMQQPELVNKQLQVLQNEFQGINESKAQSNDACTTESILLGLITEHDINKELEYQEECILQLICDDS